MGGSRAHGRAAARVGIVAAVVVVASVAAYAVTHVDSGATAGPSAVEQAGGRTAGRDGTTTTALATVPPTTPPPSAPATTAGGGRAPATTTPAPPVTGGGGPLIAPPGRSEQWGLPQGKLTIHEEKERDVYNAFLEGCDIGRMSLDTSWQQLRSPRTDFLFLAAVHVCRGEIDEGRRFFDRGGAEYGDEWANWGGVEGSEATCLTYRAVRSVLDNVPQASVTCPAVMPNMKQPTAGGPPWEDEEHCDRPTTDADECPPPPVAAGTAAG